MRSGIMAATVPSSRVQIICRCNSVPLPYVPGNAGTWSFLELDAPASSRDVGGMIACIYHDILSISGYLVVTSGAIAAYIAQPFRRR
jgi:hypothetical protein